MSTSPSISLNSASGSLLDDAAAGTVAAEDAAAWKQEVNARLAAHRSRRPRKGDEHPTLPGIDAGDLTQNGSQRVPASTVAAKVAARYAKAPSYSEMLAAEAQNAASAAAAAAKAAHQAHTAAQAILTGLDLRPVDSHPAQEPARHAEGNSWAHSRSEERRRDDRQVIENRASHPRSETRREPWQDTVASAGQPQVPPDSSAAHVSNLRITLAEGPEADARLQQVEEYFAPEPLPANLIQFPRELVAARKARPRLEEGPLRDEQNPGSERSQLRIFEVEPESISTVPQVEPTRTEWSSIRLDARPAYAAGQPAEIAAANTHRDPIRSAMPTQHVATDPEAHRLDLPLETAPLEDRCMAAVVDLSLTVAAFLLYVLVFVACTTYPPTGKLAIVGAAISFLAISIAYQLLFFSFAEGTPGMRYAKIALCTFDDENPTRRAMRMRIAALLLSLCPLGLGCAWIFFDEDHLSWHDRITRSYQRSYR